MPAFTIKKLQTAILLFLCSFVVKAQTTNLTIGEVYNWQIGDTLVYQPYYWQYSYVNCYSNGWCDTILTNPVGFSVVSKTNSGDSITYELHYFDNSDTSITIHNLDSSVLAFSSFPQIRVDTGCFATGLPGDSFPYPPENYQDSMSYDQNFSYRKSLRMYYCPLPYTYYTVSGWAYWKGQIDSGIGVINYLATIQTDPGNASTSETYGCGYNLIRYSSGNLMWSGNKLISAGQSPKVFPNPTSGNIYIIPSTNQQEVITRVIVYDMLCHPAIIRQLTQYESVITVDLSKESNGLYMVVLLDKNGQEVSKVKVLKQ